MPGDAEELQQLARGLATGELPWTAALLATVVGLFDALAPTWNAAESTNRFEPVQDALTRGALLGGTCLELGSGTGQVTPLLASSFARVLCVDVSMEMLRQAVREHAPGMPVRADGSRLPLPDQSTHAVVAVDTFLSPMKWPGYSSRTAIWSG
jgi:ubiquinone/menaquinone biosynthesis C-methylase UbiE